MEKKKQLRPKFDQDLLDEAFNQINGGNDDELEEGLKYVETYGFKRPKKNGKKKLANNSNNHKLWKS